MPSYGWSFLIALGVSVALTPIVRAFARRVGMVGKPRPDRWHKKPTALLGGIGIYVGFLAAYFFFRDSSVHGGGLLVLCASAMFALGLIDDVVHLKPYAKLIGQIVAATVLTTHGLRLPWTQSLIFDQAITIFWLVGVTNAMNLLDNIDGLAGGIAAIGGLFMTYFFVASGQFAHAALSAAFAGAVIGFLVFNFNPASIFMGDCGSLFLGYFLGAAALLHPTHRSRSLVAVLAPPVLVMAIPILDTTLVTLTRKLNGRPVSQGGRDHTSHRLVALGLSERAATLTLYGFAIASGLVGVAAFHFPRHIAIALLPLFLMILLFVAVYLGRVKVYEGVTDASVAKGRALIPTLADFTYKRRIFEVLSDFMLIIVAYYCAFLLRFDGELLEPHWTKFRTSVPIVIVVQLGVFLAAGLYQGLWRYTSLSDMRRFVLSSLLAVGGSVIAVYALFRGFFGFSRAMFIIDGMLLFLGVSGSRISFRLIRNWLVERLTGRSGKRVLIYGAGDAGELLLREIRNNEALGLLPIGFVDDDPAKTGKLIHGVRVVGTSDSLVELLPELDVQEVVVSSAKLDQTRVAAINEICRQREITFRRARFAVE
jgi:UDP-GlcNAc:undecaprenyl-phosphate GlcNAc-1-phosphate transferase